jgi:hypothetical protein
LVKLPKRSIVERTIAGFEPPPQPRPGPGEPRSSGANCARRRQHAGDVPRLAGGRPFAMMRSPRPAFSMGRRMGRVSWLMSNNFSPRLWATATLSSWTISPVTKSDRLCSRDWARPQKSNPRRRPAAHAPRRESHRVRAPSCRASRLFSLQTSDRSHAG